tara:strand:+ start:163 stop:1155 length:993 start_codon:yes stop_codon:yes gene_type:complete
MIFKSYLIEQNIGLLRDKLSLFYGENVGLQNEFKNKIKFDNKEAKIIYLDQESIIKNTESFFEEILNFSLFDKRKVFLIDGVNDKILSLIEEIDSKISEQKIYLFSNLLDKKSKLRNYFEKSSNTASIPCYLDNEITFKKIILEKLKDFKGLNQQNVGMIIESCSLDRVKLNNEISKIITFFDNKDLNTKKLESLLNIELNHDFNDLRDSAIKGNKLKTNKLLNNTVIDVDKSVYYLALLNQRFIKLDQIHNLEKAATIEQKVENLKPPIFWKEKPNIIDQLKKWNSSNINKAMKTIYNIEIKIKTNSTIDKNIIIKKLIVDICNLANAS